MQGTEIKVALEHWHCETCKWEYVLILSGNEDEDTPGEILEDNHSECEDYHPVRDARIMLDITKLVRDTIKEFKWEEGHGDE